MTTTVEKSSTYGILTDAGIERLRQKLGIQYNSPRAPHNVEASVDGLRHFAFGYGDDNPLWYELEYAAKTSWGKPLAPPNFIYTMGERGGPEPTAEQKAILKGDPLAGLGSYQAVMDFEWWRPIHIGDRLKLRCALVGVQPRTKSEFSGRNVAEVTAFVYANQHDELVAMRRGTWIRAERHASASRKKEYELPKPYSVDQMLEIDQATREESRRGASTLYWEDVKVGEEIQRIVRGPLRLSDLIIWHMGWGMQLTPPGAFRLSHAARFKAPGMFTPNALNVPDTVQRLHWETETANAVGSPLTYDYGGLRETFMTNLVTNWMGDNAWLWKLTCEHRKFVYAGDTYWIKGKVADKRQIGQRNEVQLDVWIENQWGTVVSPGNAIVLLPSKTQELVLPQPPQRTCDGLFEYEIAARNTAV